MRIIITIRSYADGSTSAMSVPSIESMATRARENRDTSPSKAAVYAMRIANALNDFQKTSNKLIVKGGEDVVVFTISDTAAGGVSIHTDPSAKDIFVRRRDNITPLSMAEHCALAGIEAALLLSSVAKRGITLPS